MCYDAAVMSMSSRQIVDYSRLQTTVEYLVLTSGMSSGRTVDYYIADNFGILRSLTRW